MRDSELSRLVTGRTAKHLQQAAMVISVAACLIVAIMSVFEWQYNKARQEFLDNPTVHFIEISMHYDGQTQYPLGWNDVATIAEAAMAEARGPFQVAPVFGIGFGVNVMLPDDQVTSVQIFGIPEHSAWLLGLSELEHNLGYSTTSTGTLDLQVAQWNVTPNGWEAFESTPVALQTAPMPTDAPISLFSLGFNDDVYVDESTFAVLAEFTLGQTWDSIRSQIGPGNPWNLELMPHIYVYLDRLGDVRPVAEATRANDYLSTYVLEGFTAVPETLRTGFWAGLAVAVLALLAGLVLSVVLVRSYLRLSHKDMGILRHLGCAAERARHVYARPIRRVLLAAAGVAVIVALGLGAGLGLGWWFIVVNTAVPVLMVGGVMVWALVWETPRHTRLPVLELLKLNREFE